MVIWTASAMAKRSAVSVCVIEVNPIQEPISYVELGQETKWNSWVNGFDADGYGILRSFDPAGRRFRRRT